MICNGMQLDRKFTRIRTVLKTKTVFPFFQKKKISVHVAYSNHFLLTKTLKQWEKDNISYSVHDITVFETSVFVHLHENDKWAIKPAPKTPFSCGRTAKTEKKSPFSKASGLYFTDQ